MKKNKIIHLRFSLVKVADCVWYQGSIENGLFGWGCIDATPQILLRSEPLLGIRVIESIKKSDEDYVLK